jgi:DNA polymerase-1
MKRLPFLKPESLYIQEEEALIEYLEVLKQSDYRVLDTEKTGLTLADELLGITLYTPGQRPAFVFVDTPYFDGIQLSRLIELLDPHFAEGVWIGHNIKFDIWTLLEAGFTPPTNIEDTMGLFHSLNTDGIKNLEYRTKVEFGYDKKKFKELVGKNWDKIDWLADTRPSANKKTGEPMPPLITVEKLGNYAAEDGFFTWCLYHIYKDSVEEDADRSRVYNRIEMPLLPVLVDMKHRGVNIDAEILYKMQDDAEAVLADLTQQVYEMAEMEFNLGSPKQLAHVLYDRLKIPIFKRTPKGEPSTDKHVMEELVMRGYPIAELLKEHSEVDTLLSGFIRSIPTLLDADGRLRGDLNSFGTATGRFSSSGPNLQNQPNKTRFPVRQAFIPSPGNVFLVFDYSQIEPRLMAHMSQDRKLLDIYHTGGDIYQGIADEIHITRKQAKVLVLALMYGMGPDKMAATLKITVEEAKAFIFKFFRTFRTFEQWKHHIEASAKEKKYCQTLFGRKRLLPHVTDRGSGYFQALRQAVNTTIQGSAADLIKITMVELFNHFKNNYEAKTRPFQVLQVHDEIVIDCPPQHALRAKEEVRNLVENLITFRVPIKIDIKTCDNWAQMKDDSFPGIDSRLNNDIPIWQLLTWLN